MRDWVWAIKVRTLRPLLPYFLALCFHALLIFLIAGHKAPVTVFIQENSVYVTLVEADPSFNSAPKERLPSDPDPVKEVKKTPPPADIIEPYPDKETRDEVEDDLPTTPAVEPKRENTAPSPTPDSSATAPIKPSGNRLVPYNPRWRLKPGVYRREGEPAPNANPVLSALKAPLDCFGFEEDCAAQRKEVFKEQQMSERDKVWTQKYAHTGLPIEYYGLSEQEIRRRLNIPTAGQNGLVIIPGLLAIDGPIWDSMHGVNKSCGWTVGSKDQDGQKRHIKKCPELKEAAKDTQNYLSRKKSLEK